jgi:UDP-N-acetylmuramoylalanine--D-glutamate ligase
VDLQGKRVLVVGLGASGLAAVRVLSGLGARVVANDIREVSELGVTAERVRELGAELVCGGHDPALFTSVDRIVLSPGVPPLPALDAADSADVPVSSEIELASWFLRGKVIGITGTNGKSTVTTLVGEMCAKTGRPTFVGGNLGRPLVEAIGSDAANEDGLTVVELSSFQLERVEHFHADIAALLNLTEDHLDRYRTFEQYTAAKARVFNRQQPDDAAVIHRADNLCKSLAERGLARVWSFGGEQGSVRVVNGRIVDSESDLSMPVDALGIRGLHNVDNACAAALLARLAGVTSRDITDVLRSFKGLPHRMVHVRDLDGVAYFDDSKATNVGATAAALDGFAGGRGRVVLIAGGKHKGGDYQPVRDRMDRFGRAAVLIGEAAPLLDRAFQGADFAVEHARTLEQAVERASRLAQPGDTVLLAPACSSFDMFRSYVHRGQIFQQAVKSLPGGHP